MKGKVKFYKDDKGYGFITSEDGKDYFVHMSGLSPGTSLKQDDAVEFEVVQGDRGEKAENVKLE